MILNIGWEYDQFYRYKVCRGPFILLLQCSHWHQGIELFQTIVTLTYLLRIVQHGWRIVCWQWILLSEYIAWKEICSNTHCTSWANQRGVKLCRLPAARMDTVWPALCLLGWFYKSENAKLLRMDCYRPGPIQISRAGHAGLQHDATLKEYREKWNYRSLHVNKMKN